MRKTSLFLVLGLAILALVSVTNAQVPGLPTQLTPANGATVPWQTTLSLTWTPASGSTSTRFIAEFFNGSGWVVVANLTTTQNNVGMSGLFPSSTYRWKLAGINGSGEGAFTGYWYFNTGALPIQLASFTGIVINTNIRLDWRTVSETNNYGFYVQRKQPSASEWIDLPNNFIAGHGTTLEPRDYTWTDVGVSVGAWSYRLKQVDLDGSIHFTNTINVSMGPTSVDIGESPLEFKLEQNYPNPFNPTTTIEFTVSEPGPVRLSAYNLVGQEMGTLLDLEDVTAGRHSVTFDGTGLSSGVYFYRLESGRRAAMRRMVLMK